MWKVIDFWNILPIYEINEYGTVRNIRTKRIRKSHYDKYGYLSLVLYDMNHNRKNFKVHRLCAKAFIPTDNDRLEVNHENGIKDINHYTNLSWVTTSDNQIHARKHGLHGRNILSESDIETLVRMVIRGKSTHEILEHFTIGKKREDPRFVQFVRRICGIKRYEIYKDIIDKTVKEFNDYPLGGNTTGVGLK